MKNCAVRKCDFEEKEDDGLVFFKNINFRNHESIEHGYPIGRR
jgi:hypothetical protein